jgi:predicted extracellular nuclease
MPRRYRLIPFTFRPVAYLLIAVVLVTCTTGAWKRLPPLTALAKSSSELRPSSQVRANPGVKPKTLNHSADDLQRGPLFANPTSTVFINEILYDITGTDTGEFVEVAAPAGTNMADYSIVLYNGSGGAIYDTDALSGTTTNQSGGYGFVSISYPSNGIQNGAPDGIALINTSTNTLVQFLCYEGTFVGVGGLANGVTCTDIGVSQSGTNAAGTSLQLQGTGTTYGDFTWNATSIANTQNAVNTGQTFTGGPPVLTLNIGDVTMAEGNAGTTAFIFNVSLTGGTAPAGGVTFGASTADGTTNPANAPGDYSALVNQPGSISSGGSSTTVTVQVNGDMTNEPSETFFVNISNIVGATPGDVQGLGTISNDDATLTPIHTIQGSGSTSPLVSTSVTTSGIVTGTKSNGFFMQEPDATIDADPNTSEGIFVFTSSASPAAAAIGNSVQVTGTVQEFIPSSDPTSPPVTELISPTVVQLSTGNPLPAPISITAAETTQASETTNPLDSLEEYEGMRVTVASLTVSGATQGTITEPSATVASSGVFIGVVTGVARPFREPGIAISDPVPAPNPANVPRFDENPQRIRVDSDAQPGTTAIDVAAGTIVTNITGPLDYAFRCYTIDPDAATPPTVGAQPGSVPVPTPTADELTVASFNMERFFDTVNDPTTSDPILTTAAFNRRVAKASLIVRTVQKYPDVIGVEEVENLSTLQSVATQINNDAVTIDMLPNPNYTAYLVEGNDIGGIDVGFLVKQSRVTQYSVTQLELGTCDHVTPSTCNNYVDPNTGTLDILNDRPALVLIASIPRTGGGLLGFTVIVNHLRSLNGVDDTTVAGTGTVGARVREKRRKQAEFLANYIQGRQTANPNEKIITVGDMNAFRVNDGYVDSIGTLLGTPAPADQVVLPSADLVNPNQTDLLDTLSALQLYSYNFDGNTQTLDHIIVNPPALAILSRFAYARNDSDFAVKNYESTNELRISDHDQPVAYFSLSAPTAANGSITGRITNLDGGPVSGATIQVSGTQTRKSITDTNGNYHFDNVETNGFYTVTPSRVNYTFSPLNRSFSLLGVRTEASFTAAANGDNANAIDTTEYFVRQQYLDFLGREPDPPGFMGWVNTINSCAANDASCDRVHVSEMFFRSQEFQERGYFAYRFYATALGRKPDYAEFAPDLARVSGFLTNDQLEAAMVKFVDDFMARPAFAAQYNGLSNSAYVDALENTAGVNLSNRQALIDSLNRGTATRAQVLRQIAESGEVYQKYYNSAFVVMEYFGYLHRDPDALYLNWIVGLDANPSDSRRMVNGFINSTEYRNRFMQ